VPFRSVASHLVRVGSPVPGLDLDVLRPPTYKALSATLGDAAAAGRPYHLVHFDGHGTWADLSQGEPGKSSPDPRRYSMLSPSRPGTHGYLCFEDPTATDNVNYVDGPALGTLLATTGVSVLVLNACRSAHAESSTAEDSDEDSDDDAGTVADTHARIRAYGSLAQEVVDAGVAGVVAMAYNVYVVTAAAFVGELYRALVGGQALGQAVTRGRQGLAADPYRSIAYDPLALQDWMVPVAYEAAPLVLFAPRPGVVLDAAPAPDVAVPTAPDVGFFGRDEALLALDRAFDDNAVVLLHALAGAGKSATAAEFARWYLRTDGTDKVLWSSFEQPVVLADLLEQLADAFAPALAPVGWSARSGAGRRAIALSLLAQRRLLWVWDNVEPVAGFPPGSPSAWTAAEQAELRKFLADVRGTGSKVLLTSRHRERSWLGDLAAPVELGPMPMRERVELARAVASRQGQGLLAVEDWRALLAYSEGNPLTVTLVVSQALRQGLTTKADVEAFVERLRAGEALEDGAEAEGRSRSLGASLRYGFGAFDGTDQARLGLLGLFQGFVDVDALVVMGNPQARHHLAALGAPDRQAWTDLLDRAADAGLLGAVGGGYYRLHPALPWFLAPVLINAWGPAPDHGGATRAYAMGMAAIGNFHHDAIGRGAHQAVAVLGAEEANLLHARRLALAGGWWEEVIGPMQGLGALYGHHGRTAEWARLVGGVVDLYTDPATDGPLAGREKHWSIVTGYRVRLALAGRDWAEAERLQRIRVAVNESRAAEALTTPPAALTAGLRNRIRSLSVSFGTLGQILMEQGRAECADHYRHAIDLDARIGDRTSESTAAFNLGHALKDLPELRDLDGAERWYRRSLELLDEGDVIRRARSIGELGSVALLRFDEAIGAGADSDILLRHLNAALAGYLEALRLVPPELVADLAVFHNQLGLIYRRGGMPDAARDHYQRSIRSEMAQANRFGAGQTRFNIALMLAGADRRAEALLFARAALTDFEHYGERAASDATDARALIALLEEGSSGSA